MIVPSKNSIKMNQQPDKLVREKLDTFVHPIPDRAWSRIERKLDKNATSRIWLRMAASFLILCAASFTIWLLHNEPDPIENNIATNNTEQTIPLDSAHQTKKNSIEEKVDAPKGKETKQKKVQKKTITKDASIQKEGIQIIFNEIELEHDVEEITNKESYQGELFTRHDTLNDTSKYKLVLQADAVNEKYLGKKYLAAATSPEKKSSTIKKLLNKAYDLKTNQDPFGELRQMKDEILALEFRNDKKKIQNKQ